MLEKVQMSGVEEKDLGIGLQLSTQIGDHKTGELKAFGFTAGFPLDWSFEKINTVIDKLTAILDRQQRKYDLVALDHAIKNNYLQLDNVLHQQTKGVESARLHFATRGKVGDFSLNDKQQADYNNHESNIKMLRDAISKQEKMFEELRERCR